MRKTSLFFMILFLLSACKVKEDVAPGDLNRHIMAISSLTDKTRPVDVYAFAPGGIVRTYMGTKPYSFADSIVTFEENGSNAFTLFDGQVTAWKRDGAPQYGYKIDLKWPAGQSELNGKHFAGTYYKVNGSVLHSRFHYSFYPSSNTFQAWLEDKTTGEPRAGLRTQSYQSFANMQAYHQFTSGTYQGDEEILTFMDGKLYVSYYDAKNRTRYGGIFNEAEDSDNSDPDPQDIPSCSALLPSVSFKAKSIRISSDNEAILSSVANTLRNDVACKVAVTGYCNNSLEDRQRSWDRVFNVIKYLTEKQGIDRTRLIFQYAKASNNCGTVDLFIANRNHTGEGMIPPRP